MLVPLTYLVFWLVANVCANFFLGPLSQISELGLDINRLTGTLPASWSNLTEVTHCSPLKCIQACLTATHIVLAHHLSGVQSMPHLLEHDAAANIPRLFIGCKCLCQLTSWSTVQLSVLNLNTNRLTGTLSASWSNLMKVTCCSLLPNTYGLACQPPTSCLPANYHLYNLMPLLIEHNAGVARTYLVFGLSA